jgi:hypothetical protein
MFSHSKQTNGVCHTKIDKQMYKYDGLNKYNGRSMS